MLVGVEGLVGSFVFVLVGVLAGVLVGVLVGGLVGVVVLVGVADASLSVIFESSEDILLLLANMDGSHPTVCLMDNEYC